MTSCRRKSIFGTGLPNRFINIAVPVNFFHLDIAVGLGSAFPIIPAGFTPLESAGLAEAIPIVVLLIGVVDAAGTAGLEIIGPEGCPATVVIRVGALTDGVDKGCG